MPEEILARCGCRCDLCLAYRENVEKEDRRKLLSDGWYKYFGFRIEPEDIVVCDGCLSDDCLKTSCSIRNVRSGHALSKRDTRIARNVLNSCVRNSNRGWLTMKR